jgi:hypothetical protein
MPIISLKSGIKSRSLLVGNPSYVPPSFESIASATGTGSSGTITFSSIPQTYTHLQIRGIARLTADTVPAPINVRYNGITTSTYFNHRLLGNGTSAIAAGNSANSRIYQVANAVSNNETANCFGVFIIDIHDYASTTKTKTLRCFWGNLQARGDTNEVVGLSSGASTATTAVTSIDIFNESTNFTTTTSFALYGIK